MVRCEIFGAWKVGDGDRACAEAAERRRVVGVFDRTASDISYCWFSFPCPAMPCGAVWCYAIRARRQSTRCETKRSATTLPISLCRPTPLDIPFRRPFVRLTPIQQSAPHEEHAKSQHPFTYQATRTTQVQTAQLAFNSASHLHFLRLSTNHHLNISATNRPRLRVPPHQSPKKPSKHCPRPKKLYTKPSQQGL